MTKDQAFNPDVSKEDSLLLAEANSGKNAKRLASIVRAQDQEILALKAQVNALRDSLEGCAEALSVLRDALPACGLGDGKNRRADAFDPSNSSSILELARDSISKSPAQCLDEHDAEVRRKAFEDAAGCVPLNWCDELLTGPSAYKWPDCRPVEKLLNSVRERITDLAKSERKEK